MAENSEGPKIQWTSQNLVTVVLLVIVIVLLTANLFRNPAVQVVAPQDDYQESGGRRDKGSDRGKDEDPYIANQVKNTIVKGYVDIRDCYNKFIDKNPTVTDGKIMIDWTIKPEGTVEKAELVSSEIPDDELPKCMVEKITKFEFPPPPGGRPKYVAHKFLLKKDTGEKK